MIVSADRRRDRGFASDDGMTRSNGVGLVFAFVLVRSFVRFALIRASTPFARSRESGCMRGGALVMCCAVCVVY